MKTILLVGKTFIATFIYGLIKIKLLGANFFNFDVLDNPVTPTAAVIPTDLPEQDFSKNYSYQIPVKPDTISSKDA